MMAFCDEFKCSLATSNNVDFSGTFIIQRVFFLGNYTPLFVQSRKVVYKAHFRLCNYLLLGLKEVTFYNLSQVSLFSLIKKKKKNEVHSCEVCQKKVQRDVSWHVDTCSTSPLLVSEQLVSLQPGSDPGVMGQVVLGTGRLEQPNL